MQIEHKKNTLYYLAFPMITTASPETFITGESVSDTAYYKDGAGAWTSLAIADTVSEIASTGMYEIDLTAAELNHDQVIIKMTSASAADTAYLFNLNTLAIDDLATSSALSTTDGKVDTAQLDLNIITGADGVNLLSATQASIDAIEADTNELQGDWVNGGRLDLIIDAILADTNELQGDWTNGGRLDLILDQILADTGTDGVAISATTANQIADAILNRDMSAVSDTNARTLLNAARFLRNKYSVAGSTLTVTKEDDSTSAWTSTLTSDAAADPVTGSDPA